jgi:hypothetical protein
MTRIKIKHPGPRGWAGIVESAFDPEKHERYEESASDFSRDGIAKMKKADAAELLEAHGVEVDGRWSADTVREKLTEVMFVGAD